MTIKIAALDVTWFDLPIEARLERIAELGFKGVQFWLTTAELGVSDRLIPEWPPTHKIKPLTLSRRELAALVKDVGLTIEGIGAIHVLGERSKPGFPGTVDTGRKRTERLKDIKDLFDCAVELEANFVLIESGGDADKPEHWQPFIENMKELADYAEDSGMVLAVENSPQVLIKDENAQLRLVKEIGSKAVRIMFDPANLNLCPPGDRDVPGAIKKLKNLIISVHAKDSIYGGGPYGKGPDGKWNCPPIGRGTVPWKECLKALDEIGYDGYLVIEYFAPGRKIREGELEKAVVEGKAHLEKLMAELRLSR